MQCFPDGMEDAGGRPAPVPGEPTDFPAVVHHRLCELQVGLALFEAVVVTAVVVESHPQLTAGQVGDRATGERPTLGVLPDLRFPCQSSRQQRATMSRSVVSIGDCAP